MARSSQPSRSKSEPRPPYARVGTLGVVRTISVSIWVKGSGPGGIARPGSPAATVNWNA